MKPSTAIERPLLFVDTWVLADARDPRHDEGCPGNKRLRAGRDLHAPVRGQPVRGGGAVLFGGAARPGRRHGARGTDYRRALRAGVPLAPAL
jgi:hypothetical protein